MFKDKSNMIFFNLYPLANGGAGEWRPNMKIYFQIWLSAPPACCLARCAGELVGVQPAPPLPR